MMFKLTSQQYEYLFTASACFMAAMAMIALAFWTIVPLLILFVVFATVLIVGAVNAIALFILDP